MNCFRLRYNNTTKEINIKTFFTFLILSELSQALINDPIMKRILGLDLGTTSIGWALVNEAETMKNSLL